MKYISKIMLLFSAMVIPFAGCDTDTLHDLNVNPQAVEEINMSFLFSAAQLSAASGGAEGDNRYIDWRTNIGYCAYWMQHLANAGTGGLGAGDKYFENVESENAPWEFIYGGMLKNLNEVLKQTGEGGFEEGKRPNVREAARILRAFLFFRLVDYYGNIPYTEALQGIEFVYTPGYDQGADIYATLLNELDEASAALSTGAIDQSAFIAADMYFKGDVTKWQKWAHSIMLRHAMRVSNVNPSLATTYVDKALTAPGVMTTNADNVWVPMSETPGLWVNQNGISRAFIPGDGGQSRVMSKTLIDALKGPNTGSTADDDPRLMIYTEGLNANVDPLVQAGMPNGLDVGTLDAYTGIKGSNANILFSLVNMKLLDRADPYLLMGAFEVELLLAEAKERGIGTVPGTAKSHYEAGVTLNMKNWTPYDPTLTVSDAAITSYLATYPYTDGSADALKMIGNQLWLGHYMNWWEAWGNYRRTGFPALVEVNYPGNITGGKIPTRLRYPTHEVATNSANISAGGTTPDNQTGKVFWDN